MRTKQSIRIITLFNGQTVKFVDTKLNGYIVSKSLRPNR